MADAVSNSVPRVVIIGAGFAGLEAAKRLANKPVQVTLVDRKNYHTFQPLLYQVATAGLSPGDIAAPVRHILRHARNIEVLLAEVTGINLAARRVLAGNLSIAYDYLIVAAGATHSYFSHPEWRQLAPGLKTIEDALEIRRRVLLAYELAERQSCFEGSHQPLNFVIIGGGPTGVELAGTLAEIARHTLAHDFRHIDPARTRVIVLEGAPRLLPAYAEDLSASAARQLKRLGVEVHLGAIATDVSAAGVSFTTGTDSLPEFLSAGVVLWAAGVAASPLGRVMGGPTDRSGRVLLSPDLSLLGHREVFVIGDLAALNTGGRPVPGLAPAAMQQGDRAARNLLSDLKRRPRRAFVYRDKGMLATIGRAAAIAQFGRVHISGYPAWLAWLFIHIFFLIGFRNRLAVMFSWAISYLTFERSVRLITDTAQMPSASETEILPSEQSSPPRKAA